MSGATAETVAVAGEPVALRVSGRIARAADHTWRVGVRASGLVQAVFVNLGDTVPKGKVLARYHADEARDERAKYRSAVAELQRLQSAAALAKRNLDRAQSLFELKAVTAKWNCDARIKTSSDRDGNVKVGKSRDDVRVRNGTRIGYCSPCLAVALVRHLRGVRCASPPFPTTSGWER